MFVWQKYAATLGKEALVQINIALNKGGGGTSQVGSLRG
jgi:hypothetical protein